MALPSFRRLDVYTYLQTLRYLGVCYDEIVFDKQAGAEVTAGGRAVNEHEDMEKEVRRKLHRLAA